MPPYLFVKTDYRIVKVAFDELLFIQSRGDYARIFTPSKKIITLQSMSKFEELLPPQQFFRIHRSYIINLEKIDSIEEIRSSSEAIACLLASGRKRVSIQIEF